MAYELRFPVTANSLSGRKSAGKKKPREKADEHLRWIRTLPPLVGTHPVEAAHIRYADGRHLKPAVGMGEKPDDKYVVPLGASEHRKQHTMDEHEYWQQLDIDPVTVALLLWANTGNDEAGEQIINQFRQLGKVA